LPLARWAALDASNLAGTRTAFERALEENRDEPMLHQRLGLVRKQLLKTVHRC
tara:strand:- start:1814 stop:1972 length:159 start_codon:yes stop_codon:yes gene_type:complete